MCRAGLLDGRISFTYKGALRGVHTGKAQCQNYQWHFSGVEDGGDLVTHRRRQGNL